MQKVGTTVLKMKNLLAEGETEQDMFRRVARVIASVEADQKYWEEKFYQIMNEKLFLPNFPTLRNAGRNQGNLAACLVLDVDDSRDSIFGTLKKACNAQAFGTGTGYNFSKLRPRGALIRSTGGKASGPVSFIRVFDLAIGEIIKQGGVRQGANMGILNYNHPDIIEFIKAKELYNLHNFNLSVLVTDEFMQKAIEGEEYDLIDPQTGKATGKLNAKMVFRLICKYAHKYGDPGLLFFDTTNRAYPSDELVLTATNPCGESYLHPGEYCNLGSINIRKVYELGLDGNQLKDLVYTAVRFLDNVIDVNNYSVLPETEETSKATRKIGLGMMGLADYLILRKIPYDSDEAIAAASEMMKKINQFAVEASEALAEEKGPFPLISKFKFSTPRRNAQVTNIAPTGTISYIAGCSPGIEPLFGVAYKYQTGEGKILTTVHDLFEKVCEERGLDYNVEEIFENRGSIQSLDFPSDIKNLFKTAHDIHYRWHVKMQGALQKHVEISISKTVNLPSESTEEDVAKVYMMAWKEGCKGITIYRDGTIANQPVQTKSTTKSKKARPKILQGETERFDLGECGKLYVTINYNGNQEIEEIFLSRGFPGGCSSAQTAALAITLSTSIRSGADPYDLAQKLKQIKCGKEFWDENHVGKEKIYSCAHAIGIAIERFIKRHSHKLCPNCGEEVIQQEGCESCPNCGWGKCSLG